MNPTIVHHTISDDLLGRWRELWQREPNATLNARPERFLRVARALDSPPVIIEIASPEGSGLVLARNETVALTTQLGYLRMKTLKLNTLVVCYGGVIGGSHVLPNLLNQCDQIVRSQALDVIFLNKIKIEDLGENAFRGLAHTVRQPPGKHWTLRLQDSFEETMMRHSSRHRKRLRWELRNIEQKLGSGFKFSTYECADDTDRVLQKAADISRQSYHATVGGSVEYTRVWQEQLKDAALSGSLRAHFAEVDQKPLAFVLCINENSTLHVIAMAFLPEIASLSLGKHVLLRAIERACEDDMNTVDYGFGDAEYKRIYGSECFQESEVRLYGSTTRARTAHLVDATSQSCDVVLNQLVTSSGVRRIKKAWRNRLSGRKD